MSIRERVTRLCISTERGKERPNVFLSRKLFQQFEDAMLPLYREQYGALITYAPAAEAGYQNVMYLGRGVCLGGEDELDEQTTRLLDCIQSILDEKYRD